MLEGMSLFQYTETPFEVFEHFSYTHMPPKGYLLIALSEESQGFALIHERHLELVDRPFRLGDKVKRNLSDTMSGIVVDATRKCTLEPIVYQPCDFETGECASVRFTEDPLGGFGQVPASGTRPCMLYGVPESELRNFEDFSEGDYIIRHQRLGVIRRVERDISLLLADSKVVCPLDTNALEAPLRDDSTTEMPSWDLEEKDLGDGKTVWTYSEKIHIYPGQSVITKKSNLSPRDRPGGPGSVVQGYVLAAPATEIYVQWLSFNVFSSAERDPYRQIDVLRASQLQDTAIVCDFNPQYPSSGIGHDSKLLPGDRVRFRNPELAYRPIPSEETFGCDMNIFRVVLVKTEVVVQWQDGSRTSETANSLFHHNDGGSELHAGALVSVRDKVKVLDKSSFSSEGHTAHKFRHRRTQTVRTPIGVIQEVNRERVASVRWYVNPGVELIYNGNASSYRSSLGKLCDVAEQVSIYEITKFPALDIYLGASVIVAPSCIEESVISSMIQYDRDPKITGVPHLYTDWNYRNIYAVQQNKLIAIKSAMVTSDWFKNTTTIRPPSRQRYILHKGRAATTNEFFGKVIAMDTDGNITVRFPGLSGCHDAQVPFERIMMLVTPFLPSEGRIASPSTREEFYDWDSIEDRIEAEDDSDLRSNDETVSIESRELHTEGKAPKDIITSVSEIHIDKRETPCDIETTADDTPAPAVEESSLPPIFRFPVPSSPPPSFALLEDLPPSDHHFLKSRNKSNRSPSIKLMQKEFSILETSLPPGIFARSWESRMDLLRVMLIGPEGTPYEHAPFVFDMQFTSSYPNEPPAMMFHSWTIGRGAVNPNLYADGRICLSLLGTWPTQKPTEMWSPSNSTVLQILISIMGLVLVKEPYYNEAGGAEASTANVGERIESAKYSEKAFVMTRRFIPYALEHPVAGLEDILIWHYLPPSSSLSPSPGSDPSIPRSDLVRKSIQHALAMITHHEQTAFQKAEDIPRASDFCERLSLGAVVLLRKHVSALEGLLKMGDPIRCQE
ncbi:hypothetical protein BDV19DRAFT_379343 [Aspergillus venezuelensis]